MNAADQPARPLPTWRPLLEGTLAERAREALDELGDALFTVPSFTPGGPAIGPGAAGVALAHAYLEAPRPGRGHLERAGTMLSDAIDWIARAPVVPWLYEGWTGLGWLLEHFSRDFFDLELDADVDPRLAMDAGLAKLVAGAPEDDGYEFCLGHAGHGLYALERRASVGPALFEAVLGALEQLATHDGDLVTWFTPHDNVHLDKPRYPRGHHNLGVAHGVAGCLGVLVSAHEAGVARARTRALIEGGVRWLERQRLAPGAASVFPMILAPDQPPRVPRTVWCEGDPGIAMVLLRAGRALGDPALEHAGLEVMRAAAARPAAATGVVDASLCHGGGGLAHLYDRAAQLTGDETLAAAARAWFTWVLDQRRPGTGLGGFTYLHHVTREWGPLGDFSFGAAGTALALTAALSPTAPAWDALMLLS